MSIIICGGGPAGMMAAYVAAKNNKQVTLIEKKEDVGKKLSITGKGRCNITHSLDNEYFFSNIVSNHKFLYSAIAAFDNNDLINFCNSIGVRTKNERGNRVFLESDNAKVLVSALKAEIVKIGVKIITNNEVKTIEKATDNTFVVSLKDGTKLTSTSVLIATGGKSYPATGSEGDGYYFAKSLGHSIVTPRPALVPLIVKEKSIVSELQGLSLRNIQVSVEVEDKELDSRFGEMLFTSKGMSGPTILSTSSRLTKVDNIDSIMKSGKVKLYIDLKPALTSEQLYTRITRDFLEFKNKEVKNSLGDLIPKSLIPVVLNLWEINVNKQANSVTKEEKIKLVDILKKLSFTIDSFENITAGIVTSGGVNVKEVNPRTMESKKVSGLYFAGEVLDVDGYTGGFNLQIAFSTGYLAGQNM